MKKIITYHKSLYDFFFRKSVLFISWFKLQSIMRKLGIITIGVVVLFGIIKLISNGDTVTAEKKVTDRKVIVASVSALSNADKDFPLVGTVTSVNEATIRAESSGRLTYVSKKLGDMVFAGGIIAEFENSGEKASVLQAEGAYEQAKAARQIAGLNSGQVGSSLGDTKNTAINTIIGSYTTMDDAIRGKTDSVFSDPRFEQVRLLLSLPDANLASSLELKRKAIEKMLTVREVKNKTLLASSDLTIELRAIENEAQIVKTYLDDLYTAYSKTLPDTTFSQTTIDAGKATVQAARQAIATTIAGLITTRTTLSASITASQVADASGGVSSGNLASADAQIKQALGAYNASLSRLEKTRVRSPITGTLNSLTINTGDYVAAFTQVAVVSNNGALEVISSVTEEDTKRISVGSPVTIDGTVAGIVTRIASAIDPTTKKIEVRIGIKDIKSTLVNGQSVRILVLQDKKKVSPSEVKKSGPIIIPIAALKLTPQGGNVFTVSPSNTLVAVPVQEGAILGDEIQILEGLLGNEVIVTDARGLKEGQVVEVSEK